MRQKHESCFSHSEMQPIQTLARQKILEEIQCGFQMSEGEQIDKIDEYFDRKYFKENNLNNISMPNLSCINCSLCDTKKIIEIRDKYFNERIEFFKLKGIL